MEMVVDMDTVTKSTVKLRFLWIINREYDIRTIFNQIKKEGK